MTVPLSFPYMNTKLAADRNLKRLVTPQVFPPCSLQLGFEPLAIRFTAGDVRVFLRDLVRYVDSNLHTRCLPQLLITNTESIHIFVFAYVDRKDPVSFNKKLQSYPV